jgi:hypothetical protein
MTLSDSLCLSLSLAHLEVCDERLEVHGDVQRLIQRGHHVAKHGPEGGVVGAICQVQDAGHLPCCVRLHLHAAKAKKKTG